MFDFLKPSSDNQSLADASTHFALDLYRQLSAGNGSNLFFSPFSLVTALSMTWAGARGETARQMAQVLHFTQSADKQHAAAAALLAKLGQVQKRGDVMLHSANALWAHSGYPFLQEFIDLCRESYNASLTPLDFTQEEAARHHINTWVAEATAGNIRDLVPAGVIDRLTRLVLTNAIYFKGAWSQPFDASITRPQAFYSPSGKSQVPLMRQSSTFGYARHDRLQVLEMTYRGNDLSMLVLLPDAADGLTELEANLNPALLRSWTNALRKQELVVFLPRFRSEDAFQLNDPLKALGMHAAFDDSQADFSGMDGKPQGLFIKAVLHKAFIDVNEAGTEAAAATAVLVAQRAAFIQIPTFRADHPFLFLIRENSTGALLFLGRLVDPIP